MQKSGISPSTVTFNSLIDACVRNGRMASAWSFLDEMKELKCSPDNMTYSTLIKGIKNEGEEADLERAFGLLEEIKTNPDLQPDEILYNCLLDACIGAR